MGSRTNQNGEKAKQSRCNFQPNSAVKAPYVAILFTEVFNSMLNAVAQKPA